MTSSRTWQSTEPLPVVPPPGVSGWIRIMLRGPLLVVLLTVGLAVHAVLRLVERVFCGRRRPMTARLVQIVCRMSLHIIGLGWRTTGPPLRGPGAVVANHASWLDIFVLNAALPVTFVAKAEVAGWPGIGWLARAVGTVFIRRDRREASAQSALFENHLLSGRRLLFFPEGTSSDGKRVLPFNSTLFQAFCSDSLKSSMILQPVTVVYTAPPQSDPRVYAWWGDMSFGGHLLQILAMLQQGSVEVVFHPVVAVADMPSRKALAATCEAAVRSALTERFGQVAGAVSTDL